MRSEVAFLSLLCSGISALAAGVGLTRLHWRPDIPPYGRRTRLLPVLLRPGQYVHDAPLLAIRTLNVAGSLLLAGATGILVYELFRVVLGQ